MTEQPEGPPPATTDAGDDARSVRVGDGLKQGFAALAGPQLEAADKPRWHQRLIAITNRAKHDLETAEGRLERFWSDWEAEVGPRPG